MWNPPHMMVVAVQGAPAESTLESTPQGNGHVNAMDLFAAFFLFSPNNFLLHPVLFYSNLFSSRLPHQKEIILTFMMETNRNFFKHFRGQGCFGTGGHADVGCEFTQARIGRPGFPRTSILRNGSADARLACGSTPSPWSFKLFH